MMGFEAKRKKFLFDPPLAIVEPEPEAKSEPKETTAKETETNPAFELELLPHNIGLYAKDVARRMNNAPLSFTATAALLVLSASIGRRVGVRPKRRDNWTVIPNLWGMLIAPPSIKKSPIFSEMIKPLQKLEIEANERYEEEMAAYRLERVTYDIEMKAYREKIKEGETPPPPQEPEEPKRKRYIINDTTVEKVAEIMIDNPDGLALFMDELAGWFNTLNKQGREGDRAFWLEAFNGNGSRSVDRISRGSFFVPHVCATIFGTIQPDALMGIVTKTTKQSSGGDGLLQRFQLMAYEDSPSFDFTDLPPDTFAKEAYEETVKTMVTADPLAYGAQKDPITEEVHYRFSEAAADVFKAFSIANNKEVARYTETNPAMAAHLGKFDGLFVSLALILFYADRVMNVTTANEIPETYARKAWRLCDYYKAHALKVYDMESIEERRREALEEKIREKVRELLGQGMQPTIREVTQRVRGAKTKDVREAIKGWAIVQDKKITRLVGMS